jgi:CelD/BcsL family acetyltransferase involved in cellulose biosynthesis
MLVRNAWKAISAEDYEAAFERFGGSFALHPRVVALVASLAQRPVRYAGLIRKGELVGAVPLWGEHIVATKLALEFYGARDLIDVGDSEIVLPIADDVRTNAPFRANMISSLHAGNISNVTREADFAMTLAKGIRSGDRRLSGKTQVRRRRETRRFEEIGGKFVPIHEFSAREVAEIYMRLFEKRWSFSPLGENLLPSVLLELQDMLRGDVLLLRERPVAIELIYVSETPHYLLASGVNRGVDPEFRDHTPGSILLFHDIELLEEEARANNKTLRFSFGMNDADYKSLWSLETPAYRLEPSPQKWFKILGLLDF